MANLLETQTVTKIYKADMGTTRAVDGVSLAVTNGEFCALVGPSGSGKTTLLAMLATLLKPSEGEIIIDGQKLSQMSDPERTRFRREKIGFTFQANNLVPYLTALENVELMLKLNGKGDRAGHERTKELLFRLGLGDRLNNLPRQLSGGQQQRVAIARALVHTPALVLADEPTASLDTERAYQVVQTFANLIHEQNRAGLMVTHDLRMTEFADRVIQMMDGKVVRILSDRSEIMALAAGKSSVEPTRPREEIKRQLNFNDLAPDPSVLLATGESIQLSSLWQDKPLLLVFTRHFGCPQCKDMLDQLVKSSSELENAGLTIAAVTQGNPADALGFCRRRAPGMICLSDPKREAYHAFGLERGTVWQVALSPQVIRGTLRAGGHGHTPELPPRGQDVMQMSGTFVIGTDGRIRLPYYYENIADHAPIDLLLHGVLSTTWDRPFQAAMG
jgi:putative ABC transport system ATP-binding protein